MMFLRVVCGDCRVHFVVHGGTQFTQYGREGSLLYPVGVLELILEWQPCGWVTLVVRDDGLHAVECLDEPRFLCLHGVHFGKEGAYLCAVGGRQSVDPCVTELVLTRAVDIRFLKGWDVARKYLAHVVQECHEEDAREVGGRELIVQKICHQRHAPAVLGDALLSSGFHPCVARTLLEACDTVQDGQIIVWGHRCSFTVSLTGL